MYLEHFGLGSDPFSLRPHLRFLYDSTAFEETMSHLVYGLENGEDLTLITVEIGTGKLLDKLGSQILREAGDDGKANLLAYVTR